MSQTLTADQKIPYALFENDEEGDLVADPGDAATITLDAASPATVSPDSAIDPAKLPPNADGSAPDPALFLQTGFLLATKAGTITYTVTYTHTDGTPVPPPVTGTLPVVAGSPATGGVAFGTPASK